jgi:hypothetical protein
LHGFSRWLGEGRHFESNVEATTHFRDDHSGDDAAAKEGLGMETITELLRAFGWILVITHACLAYGLGSAWLLMKVAERFGAPNSRTAHTPSLSVMTLHTQRTLDE